MIKLILRQTVFLISLVLLLPAGTPLAAVSDESADTRILIDISGSMKKNDPKNLRRPAVRLLVGLLPEKSRAGVWTFGKYVNMQVPLGLVDKVWKERGRDGASKIGSPGQFTNIEDAIRRSTRDWQGAPDRYRRHLVLLTDGMVDVSKDPAESAASRQRILEELLPKLKELQTQVHTIALSERADHELMKALAGETGGWYEQVDNAEQLQRIFLRIFEKVGRPDTLPLKDNKFNVDASIEEVTLLIFRQADAPATKVVTPSGTVFDAETAPGSVSWHRDEGYDLLTISQPEVGEWSVQAAMDPDNRVVVVTNLKMRADELPSRLIVGETFPLTVHFTNEDKQITRKEFLDVVNINGEHTDSNGASEPIPIRDDGEAPDATAGDGLFTLGVGEDMAPGKVELVINAEGKTFQREQRQWLELVPPVVMKTEDKEQAGKPGLSVQVIPDAELLNMESYALSAMLVSLDGQQQGVMFLPGVDGVTSEAWIDKSGLQGTWTLGVNVVSETTSGNRIELDLDPVIIEGVAPAVVEPEAQEEPEIAEEPTEEQEEEYGLKEYSIIFGVGNLLLILIGGLAFWLIRRRGSSDSEIELVSDEDDLDLPVSEEADQDQTEDEPAPSTETAPDAQPEPEKEDSAEQAETDEAEPEEELLNEFVVDDEEDDLLDMDDQDKLK